MVLYRNKEEGKEAEGSRRAENEDEEDDATGRSGDTEGDATDRSKGRRSSSDNVAVARIGPSREDFTKS
jgi:hypothetical protein